MGCSVGCACQYSHQTVLGMNPDGIVLSNGPGDPTAVPYMVENIKGVLGKNRYSEYAWGNYWRYAGSRPTN